VLPLIEL